MHIWQEIIFRPLCNCVFSISVSSGAAAELAGPGAEGARGARCGDGQHRGAEDQAGVQGGAEERRDEQKSN